MSQFIRITNGDVNLGVDNGLLQSNTETAIRIAGQAKSLAPVDLGQLKNSIMWKTSLTQGDFNDGSGKNADFEILKPTEKYVAHVGFNLLYGIYQEFGTRYIKPQPFLTPAKVIVEGGDFRKVIADIQNAQMKFALKKGTRRETTNV